MTTSSSPDDHHNTTPNDRLHDCLPTVSQTGRRDPASDCLPPAPSPTGRETVSDPDTTVSRTVAGEQPDQSPLSSRVRSVDAAAVEVMAGLLVRAEAGSSGDPSVTPALAAHREALADLLAEHHLNRLTMRCACGLRMPEESTVDEALALHRAHVADAVLAYFADPAHGLTVETGAVGCECPPCPGRGNDGHGMTHCAECCFGTGVEADMECPAHGLVRDEPSEDEQACPFCNSDPEALADAHEQGWHEGREHERRNAPARSDDGRTAVELTVDEQAQISDALGGAIWTGTGSGAAVRATVRNILAARLRHDDGEADRGR